MCDNFSFISLSVALRQAHFELGMLFSESGNVSGAVMHLTAAASAGDDRACVNLGRLLEATGGEAQAEAAGWYRRAAERGDPTACFNLSMCYTFGVGGALIDSEKALACLEAAAKRGHPKVRSQSELHFRFE